VTRLNEPERALLLWIDNEATGIVQALRMAADHNEEDAKALEADGTEPRLTRLLHDSATSWRVKADQFERLYDALPMQED